MDTDIQGSDIFYLFLYVSQYIIFICKTYFEKSERKSGDNQGSMNEFRYGIQWYWHLM